MEALRIRKRIESGTLHITGLQDLGDKDVEVIILVEPDRKETEHPLPTGVPKRAPGSAKGLIKMADDFQAPLDDEAAQDFYR